MLRIRHLMNPLLERRKSVYPSPVRPAVRSRGGCMSPDDDDLELKVLQTLLDSREWPDWLVAIDADLEASVVTVTVTDRKAVDLERSIAVEADGARRDFAIRVEEGPPAQLFLFGQAHLPVPPSGPTTGGDPIWHGENGWGTLALASPQITIVDHTGQQNIVPDAMLGCNHILGLLDQAQPGDAIGLYRTPGSATLKYFWPVKDAAVDPVDVALAELSTPANTLMREVRGLGPVTGVAAPIRHERLFKCGARTSITTALDDGWGVLLTPQYGKPAVILRKTRPDFAGIGDSGAAVLNRARELVGIVIAGRLMPHGLVTYYLPTLPLGTPTKPANTLYLELEI
jgi:hypothetical protein